MAIRPQLDALYATHPECAPEAHPVHQFRNVQAHNRRTGARWRFDHYGVAGENRHDALGNLLWEAYKEGFKKVRVDNLLYHLRYSEADGYFDWSTSYARG